MKSLKIFDLGTLAYKDAYFFQRDILEEKKLSVAEDHLLLVEHPNVFTIGRTGSRDNLLAGKGRFGRKRPEVINIDRGGDITFHGAGQLVAYPIFDLRNHTKDVRFFIRNLERVMELTVSEYGLSADTDKEYTGLWVRGEKIGFIGVGISNWITYHGLSLNVNVDLKYFSMIKPCGINGLKVNSLQGILGKSIDINGLKNVLIAKICEVFGFERSAMCFSDALVAR